MVSNESLTFILGCLFGVSVANIYWLIVNKIRKEKVKL
jgi:hypothetical protein